jgi:N-acetylglucosamine kinase-like BadF-type ATPase
LHFLGLIGIISQNMTTNARYVTGLDGGGTKTTMQLADMKGTVLAETQGGRSNFQIIGIEESARTILDLLETCCHTVGCNISEIGSMVGGLTGAGRAVDQQRITEGIQIAAQKRGMYLQDLKIESDARIALEGAFFGNRGIVLIGGTGSIVFAKDSKGKITRAGGWGRFIGDEGSGYQIGREAFRAVARMIDGRGRKTRIAKLVASRYGLKTHEDIIKAVYGENLDLSSAAPLVLHAAQQKDPVAIEILSSAAGELLEAVQAALKGMGKVSRTAREKIPLVFIGGLLDGENVYSRRVKALIRKHLPEISMETPIAQPVQGAVLMAIARVNAGLKNTKGSSSVD